MVRSSHLNTIFFSPSLMFSISLWALWGWNMEVFTWTGHWQHAPNFSIIFLPSDIIKNPSTNPFKPPAKKTYYVYIYIIVIYIIYVMYIDIYIYTYMNLKQTKHPLAKQPRAATIVANQTIDLMSSRRLLSWWRCWRRIIAWFALMDVFLTGSPETWFWS